MVNKALYEGSVTLIGSLPPIKGISPYCCELMLSLSKIIPVEFIGFKEIYPDFLYPGGKSKEEGNTSNFSKISNVSIRNFLTYYNPFTWVWAGLSIKSKVVHAQWWSHILAPVYFTILFLCKIRNKKIVITAHNIAPHENSKLNKFLNGIVLRLGDKFIVHSTKNIGQLHETYNIPQEKIVMIPHGILGSYNDQIIPQGEARKRLDLPLNGKIVLFFGHIREYKGLDVIIEAFSNVVNQTENAILVVAGSPWVKWDKYQDMIDRYNLRKNIKLYLKFIPSDEAKYFYYASDLVVLPYKEFMSQSGVGAVVLAFKKPLIVTDVGGLPDFVKDKNFVVEPNNPKQLSEKVLVALKDDEMLTKLSEDSRDLAEKYSWASISETTVKLYRKI